MILSDGQWLILGNFFPSGQFTIQTLKAVLGEGPADDFQCPPNALMHFE
jgi:hypothetical protein